jgi:hypothetical protein
VIGAREASERMPGLSVERLEQARGWKPARRGRNHKSDLALQELGVHLWTLYLPVAVLPLGLAIKRFPPMNASGLTISRPCLCFKKFGGDSTRMVDQSLSQQERMMWIQGILHEIAYGL